MVTRSSRANLRLVPGKPVVPNTSLRNLCQMSWRGAKLRQQDFAVTLNVASAVGLLLEAAAGNAGLALTRVEGSDDWSLAVREQLRQILAEEAR